MFAWRHPRQGHAELSSRTLIPAMDVNPYESPAASSESSSVAPVKCGWLATVSVVLAVICEVLPTEADVLFAILMRPHSLFGYLLAKLAFLALILSPIGIYGWLNGWQGLKHAQGRVISVGLIVGVNLLMSLAVVVKLLS